MPPEPSTYEANVEITADAAISIMFQGFTPQSCDKINHFLIGSLEGPGSRTLLFHSVIFVDGLPPQGGTGTTRAI